jgi:hypothetical protein
VRGGFVAQLAHYHVITFCGAALIV